MASLTYDTARFTDVNKWDEDYSYKGILIAGKLNQKNGQDYKLLDSIDIDWNGGWLQSLGTYIYTTQDLLQALDDINKNTTVDTMETTVAQIKGILTEIVNSYVSTSYLGEVLESYQNKLIAGYHMAIDSDNVITAYGFVNNDELYAFSTAYATNARANQIESDLWDNFYTKDDVTYVARTEAKKVMDQIVDGADEAFDTLREIAEWINGQNRYEEVQYSEIVQDGEVIVDYDIYIHNSDTDDYAKVNADFILANPDETYYRICNTATDVADLFNSIMRVQNQIGYKTDNGNNTYTYTGILLDIYNLQNMDSQIINDMTGILHRVDDAESIALDSNEKATTAYNAAYSSYDLAAYSLEITVNGIDMAYNAYNIANTAIDKVGIASTPKFWRTITEDERKALADDTLTYDVYVYNEIQQAYNKVEFDPSSTEEYWIEDPGTEATGLTKRVEDAENSVGTLTARVEDVETAADSALYNLYVSNTESEYVTLALSPQVYELDPSRTLAIKTENAEFDSYTGEVTQDGLVTAYVASQIYSYMSSWIFFPAQQSE